MDIADFANEFELLFQKDAANRLTYLKNISEDKILYEYLETLFPFIQSGKRIRPYITALIYSDVKDNNWKDISNQLLAIEYFHTFALIHDDVMDRSHTRRGTPTIHAAITNKIKSDDSIHAGYSQAILIGDLLHSFSQQLFIESDNKNITNAYKIFSEMSNEVMLGQMIDLDLINRSDNVTTDLIIKKMLLKTAGYTFVNPFKIGSLLSGKDNSQLFNKLGACMGIAFQIKDDIIDIIGTKEETGKTPLCDIKEGQKTLLTDYVLSKSEDKYKNELLKYLGKDFSENDYQNIKNIFIDSGSIKHAESIASKNLDEARELLKSSDLSFTTQHTLNKLIDKLQTRKS